MTIRDFLRRRTRRIMAVGFCGWLLLPLSAFVTAGHGPPAPLFIVGFAVFGGAILTLLFWVKCPKCATPLRQLAGDIAFHWGTRRRVNFCPYCGASLDEPYEPPPRRPVAASAGRPPPVGRTRGEPTRPAVTAAKARGLRRDRAAKGDA